MPTGRLQLVSGNARSAYFIALDQVTRNGDRIDLWSYTVYEPAVLIGKHVVVQAVMRLTLDCRQRSVRILGVASFDESNKVRVSVPARAFAEEPIRPNNTYDYFSRVLCDGVQLPPSNTFMGHGLALVAGRIGIGRMPPN